MAVCGDDYQNVIFSDKIENDGQGITFAGNIDDYLQVRDIYLLKVENNWIKRKDCIITSYQYKRRNP